MTLLIGLIEKNTLYFFIFEQNNYNYSFDISNQDAKFEPVEGPFLLHQHYFTQERYYVLASHENLLFLHLIWFPPDQNG